VIPWLQPVDIQQAVPGTACFSHLLSLLVDCIFGLQLLYLIGTDRALPANSTEACTAANSAVDALQWNFHACGVTDENKKTISGQVRKLRG
jgi:hypothetical protein